MTRSTSLSKEAQLRQDLRRLARRILGIAVLAAFVLVAPAIASVNRAPRNKVRVPRIDYRAIETLLRWIEKEEDPRTKEVRGGCAA